MAGESNDKRAVFTILLVSTLLTILGIAGVLRGAYDLSPPPLPEDVREYYELDEELSEVQVQLLEAQVSNPYRRPMAAANIVVSALVLIGSFMLSWRKRIAQWWIKQAVLAKLLWIVAYTATLVHHVHSAVSIEVLEQVGAGLREVVTGIVLVGVFSAMLHLLAAYRATRPDVAAFIEAKAGRADR
jgi:hypothetical protein